MLITPEGTTLGAALAESNYVLAKGKSLEKYADVISTGLQPTRKALPQLIPDGLLRTSTWKQRWQSKAR